MPKKSTKSKKSTTKSSKTTKRDFIEQIAKDPNFKMGDGRTFVFENGDQYIGSFCVHKSGLVWREGYGVYSTHDGQIYEGFWTSDKIDEKHPMSITYQNMDKFYGKIVKSKYNGPGMYSFQSGDCLSSNFDKNQPSGSAILIDHFGRCWYGTSVQKNKMLLFMEHIFYTDLDEERGKGVMKHPPSPEVTPEEEDTSVKSEDSAEIKEKVFAKSTKTVNDVDDDFEASGWYQDSIYNTEMLFAILPKIEMEGIDALDDEEQHWYESYKKKMNAWELLRHKQGLPITNELLLRFLSDDYRNSCPPVRVMYPSSKTVLGTSKPENEESPNNQVEQKAELKQIFESNTSAK